MGDTRLDRTGPRRYSERLVGFENPNCTIPKCRSTMRSTGWLEQDANFQPPLWFMEFLCPEHGPQWVGGGEWQARIDDALRESGATSV